MARCTLANQKREKTKTTRQIIVAYWFCAIHMMLSFAYSMKRAMRSRRTSSRASSNSWKCELQSRQIDSNLEKEVGKISIASNSSHEQKRSNYQLDTRIINVRLPDELRNG